MDELGKFFVDLGMPALVAVLGALLAYKRLRYSVKKWEEELREEDREERAKIRSDLMGQEISLREQLDHCQQEHRQCRNDLYLKSVELAAIKRYLSVNPYPPAAGKPGPAPE